MTMEEDPDTNLAGGGHHQHLLYWLEDSISFIPSFLDDPYAELNTYEWWKQDHEQPELELPPAATVAPEASGSPPPAHQAELSKKRKQPTSGRRRADEENEDEWEAQRRKKPSAKASGGGSNTAKEARWAEQLLVPCAAAIVAGNLSRVQHLLYVLRELAAPSGDANHRLAAHGLRALARHLSSIGAALPPIPSAAETSASYATADPKLFRAALIKFHEVSPWFALPNALANAAIVRALDAGSPQQPPRRLHIIDVGVSHGVQWPTLLEALTRRPGGPPPLVRLTVVGPGAAPHGPFSSAPADYDFSAHLLRYAKSIELNLRIDHADFGAQFCMDHARTEERDAKFRSNNDEALIVCAQFRVGHACTEERNAFVNKLRSMEPGLLILSEVDWDSNRDGGGDGFLTGFGRRAEMVWRFLESTGAAFKGRESAERRIVEGEAAGWLEAVSREAEGAAEWGERMAAAGFREEGFGEEAVDVGRALLRKCDSNWEMRAATAAGRVGLCWKGQPVSFCSLWKLQGKS